VLRDMGIYVAMQCGVIVCSGLSAEHGRAGGEFSTAGKQITCRLMATYLGRHGECRLTNLAHKRQL